MDQHRGAMDIWQEVVEQGWLDAGLPLSSGGGGAHALAVLAEVLGYALLPGPTLPTIICMELLLRDAELPDRDELLARVRGGEAATLVMPPVGGSMLPGTFAGTSASTGVRASGTISPVWCADEATLVLLPCETDGALAWYWVDSSLCRVASLERFDLTRGLGEVSLDGVLPASRKASFDTDDIGVWCSVLGAAEAIGVARWCLDTAAEHARTRVQFGRPIGAFQAVKHRVADMLASVEVAAALVGDAASSLEESSNPGAGESLMAVSMAVAAAADAAVELAKGTVQVLGGLGFTWEHPAHAYLRRAIAFRQIATARGDARVLTARLALGGARRRARVDLPEGAGQIRPRIHDELASIAALEEAGRRPALADAGFLAPHWPRPWGRDASALEQLVIDQEMRALRIERPNLAVGAWALPTIIAFGTTDQQERFVGPTLRGELEWCQLFSEPGAGSDLASVATRAERDARRPGGGWRLTGQKVWTSLAAQADYGICLAKSDPTAGRHEGLTYFVVDMRTPGIEVRPLREITGDALFNEVFLDDALVGEENVIGEVGDGWRVARATLGNERVALSGGSTFGTSVEALIGMVRESDPGIAELEYLGRLLAEAHALRLLDLGALRRSLGGLAPGPEASLRKLLSAEHEQRVQEHALDLLGARGAVYAGEGRQFGYGFLVTRCLTIAGGTSEIQRNVIAERLLGLPRDP